MAKNKNGATGSITCEFEGMYFRFDDAEQDDGSLDDVIPEHGEPIKTEVLQPEIPY